VPRSTKQFFGIFYFVEHFFPILLQLND